MRKLLFFFALLYSSFPVLSEIDNEVLDPYNERVLHFHSDIQIQKNREVIVTETIRVNCRGMEI